MNTSPFTPPADRRISRTVGVGIAIVAAIVLTFGLAQFARQKVYISVVAADAAEQPMVTVVTKGHIRDWLPADQALKQGFGLKWGSPEGTVLVVATAPGFAPTAKLVNTRGFRSSDSPHGIIMRRSATVELVASDLPALPETWTDRLAGWQLGFTDTDEDFGWVAGVLDSLPEGEAKEKLKAAVPVVRLVTMDGTAVELPKAQERKGYWEGAPSFFGEAASDRGDDPPTNLGVYGGRLGGNDSWEFQSLRTLHRASIASTGVTRHLPAVASRVSADHQELRATVTGLASGDFLLAHLAGDGLISLPAMHNVKGGSDQLAVEPLTATTLRIDAGAYNAGMVVELTDPRWGTSEERAMDGSYSSRDLFRLGAITPAGGELGLAGIEPGEYRLHALAGEKKYSGPVNLLPGANLARIELTDLPVISGVLLDDAGKPVEGMRLSYSASFGYVSDHATTGTDGSFEFRVKRNVREGAIRPVGFAGPEEEGENFYDQRRNVEFEFDLHKIRSVLAAEVNAPARDLELQLPRRPSDEKVSAVTVRVGSMQQLGSGRKVYFQFLRSPGRKATSMDREHGGKLFATGESMDGSIVRFLAPGVWYCVATGEDPKGRGLSAIHEFEVDGSGRGVELEIEFKPATSVGLFAVGPDGQRVEGQVITASVGLGSGSRFSTFTLGEESRSLPIGQHKVRFAFGNLRPAPGMDVITVHDQPSDSKSVVIAIPTIPLPAEQIRLTTNYDPDGDNGDTVFTVLRVGYYSTDNRIALSHPDPINAKNVLTGNGLHPGLYRIFWRYKAQPFQSHFFYVDNYDEHFHFELTPEGTIRRVE